MRCSECLNDDIKEIRGCNSPAPIPVWTDGDDEFYTCPLKYYNLMSTVRAWYDHYITIKNGFCKPFNYADMSCRWFDAMREYEYYYNKYRADIQNSQHDKTGDALKTFRMSKNGEK